jgi:hypothetical protein
MARRRCGCGRCAPSLNLANAVSDLLDLASAESTQQVSLVTTTPVDEPEPDDLLCLAPYTNRNCPRWEHGHIPGVVRHRPYGDYRRSLRLHWECKICGTDLCFPDECPIPNTSLERSPA